MKIIENKGISWVKGFSAIGIKAGIKKSGLMDLCLIYSEKPAVAAATFTTNIVKAAPVLIDMEQIKQDYVRAMVINSGNANACTGEEGYLNALAMAETTATTLAIKPTEVLVYSTGVIGVQLPIDVVKAGIKTCASQLVSQADDHAAEAIMTTDNIEKTIFIEVELSGKTVSIAGMAKGSGMIHPNMATMLSYIVTDAAISKNLLTEIHKGSVENSYNMISIDGDTSTNDTATIVANGCADNPLIATKNDDFYKFKAAIDFANVYLAKKIASDGEGATKLVEVDLKGACSLADARLCARGIISSNLVKAAMHGSDANWGRILCAMGYSGGGFDPAKAEVSFKSSAGEITVFSAGMPVAFDEEQAFQILKQEVVTIIINLFDGDFEARAWGCDLSPEYVKFNGSYRS
jgi:glutamate N-acetyltransferase/amino-acid N-acetyltransferase